MIESAKEEVEENLQKKTHEVDVETCQLHNIHLDKFKALLEKFSKDEVVAEVLSEIELNHEWLFNGQELNFSIPVPDVLTPQKYEIIQRAIMGKLRREVYLRIRRYVRNNQGKMLP